MVWAKTWAKTWATGPSGYDGSIRKQRVPDAAGLSANNAGKIPCSGAKLSLFRRKSSLIGILRKCFT